MTSQDFSSKKVEFYQRQLQSSTAAGDVVASQKGRSWPKIRPSRTSTLNLPRLAQVKTTKAMVEAFHANRAAGGENRERCLETRADHATENLLEILEEYRGKVQELERNVTKLADDLLETKGCFETQQEITAEKEDEVWTLHEKYERLVLDVICLTGLCLGRGVW